MQKLREEFQHYKTRQEHWEQAYSQAKSVSISLIAVQIWFLLHMYN